MHFGEDKIVFYSSRSLRRRSHNWLATQFWKCFSGCLTKNQENWSRLGEMARFFIVCHDFHGFGDFRKYVHFPDGARCFSCMSRLYEAVWPSLAHIYKRPRNFTGNCPLFIHDRFIQRSIKKSSHITSWHRWEGLGGRGRGKNCWW